MQYLRFLVAALAVVLSACGGGGSDPVTVEQPQTISAMAAMAKPCKSTSCFPAVPVTHATCSPEAWNSKTRYFSGTLVSYNAKLYVSTALSDTRWNVNSQPEWTPTMWALAACTVQTSEPPPPPPPPLVVSDIPMGDWPNTLLQTGWDTAAYWLEDGVWGAAELTRGTYIGITGSQYEQKTGVSSVMGPNGEVTGRMSWKWPTGSTEVKSYPSFVIGNKPGWKNSWTLPGGHNVRLLNGTDSQVYPSGKTPGSFFPLQLPVQSLQSTFSYKHNQTPTGRGHLTYDIWLQHTLEQCHGFNNCKEISHEIMIPLDYWGNYGAHKVGRNPGWYDHDAVIDGRLWHVYVAKGADGQVRPDFFGGWKFIVFEPSAPVAPGSINLAAFINYVATRKDIAGTPWATGNEHVVSVELGVEPVDGTGDLTISNFRVWK